MRVVLYAAGVQQKALGAVAQDRRPCESAPSATPVTSRAASIADVLGHVLEGDCVGRG